MASHTMPQNSKTGDNMEALSEPRVVDVDARVVAAARSESDLPSNTVSKVEIARWCARFYRCHWLRRAASAYAAIEELLLVGMLLFLGVGGMGKVKWGRIVAETSPELFI